MSDALIESFGIDPEGGLTVTADGTTTSVATGEVVPSQGSTTVTDNGSTSDTKAQLLETVRGQQIALNSIGFGGDPPLDTDGQRGPLTIAATKRFQIAVGLSPDGVFGPLTKQKMLAILNGDQAPPDPPGPTVAPTAAQIIKATSPSEPRVAPTATIAAQPVSSVTKSSPAGGGTGAAVVAFAKAHKKELMIGGGLLLALGVGLAVHHHYAKAR